MNKLIPLAIIAGAAVVGRGGRRAAHAPRLDLRGLNPEGWAHPDVEVIAVRRVWHPHGQTYTEAYLSDGLTTVHVLGSRPSPGDLTRVTPSEVPTGAWALTGGWYSGHEAEVVRHD